MYVLIIFLGLKYVVYISLDKSYINQLRDGDLTC